MCMSLWSSDLTGNEASAWEEDVASVREPLYEDHEMSCSDSWDDDSEPENDLANWRVERLSREEFIAVSVNASYNILLLPTRLLLRVDMFMYTIICD